MLIYRDLAECLAPDQPFWGLQARGLDGNEPWDTTVEEMAAHYLEEIRTVQPEGPYHLTGMCLGGDIAFEMAQQLQAQGQEVGLLAILDSWIPRDFWAPTPTERIRQYIRRYAGAPLQLPRRLVESLWSRFLRSGAGSATFYLGRHEEDHLLRRLELTHERARATYGPSPYHGRIVLFLNGDYLADNNFYRLDQFVRNCSRLVAGELVYHLIPGSSHKTFLQQPHVQVLADHLRAYL